MYSSNSTLETYFKDGEPISKEEFDNAMGRIQTINDLAFRIYSGENVEVPDDMQEEVAAIVAEYNLKSDYLMPDEIMHIISEVVNDD